jgi:hypothetical protein
MMKLVPSDVFERMKGGLVLRHAEDNCIGTPKLYWTLDRISRDCG